MYAVYLINKSGRTTLYNTSWLVVGEYGGKAIGVEDPTLTMEDNLAGEFSCTVLKDNQAYDKIERMVSEIQVCQILLNQNGVARTETEIWRGRVITYTENFMHNRELKAEGELTYLGDTRQPQAKYLKTIAPRSFFEAVLKHHNSKANKNRRFTLGSCQFTKWSDEGTVSDINLNAGEDDEYDVNDKYLITAYETTLDVIKSGFDRLENAHIRIRHEKDGNGNDVRYLDILKEWSEKDTSGDWGRTRIKNQEIRLGVNMLDFSKSYDPEGLASVIIPLGAQKEGDEANLGEPMTPVRIFVSGYTGATIDENGYPIGLDDESFELYRIETLTPGSKFFYTGRQWNGYCFWTFLDSNSEPIECEQSDLADEEDAQYGVYTDIVECVVEVPEGTSEIYVSGEVTAIPLRINEYLDDADAEQYVTISKVEDNTQGRHRKRLGENCVINDALLNKYGYIETVINFEDITDPKELYNRALKYFAEEIYEDVLLEVKAYDLSLLDNSYESFKIGYTVPVTSGPHDLNNIDFPISKLEINLADPGNSTVSLGKRKRKTASSITAENRAEIKKSVKTAETVVHNQMQEIVDRVQYLLDSGANAFIHFEQSETDPDRWSEMYISDNKDINRAKAVWCYNLGGIGFSPNGRNGPYTFALTSDSMILVDKLYGSEFHIGDGQKVGQIYIHDSTIPESAGINDQALHIWKSGITVAKCDDNTITQLVVNPAVLATRVGALGYDKDWAGYLELALPQTGRMSTRLNARSGHLILRSLDETHIRCGNRENDDYDLIATASYNDGFKINKGNFSGTITVGNTSFHVSHGLIDYVN